MKERPILFSGPMVRALLDDRKTQTRRIVKPQPHHGPVGQMVHLGDGAWAMDDGDLSGQWQCPYGVPGDRLWVREAWRADMHYDPRAPSTMGAGCAVWYEAAGGDRSIDPGRLRAAMHMPRWASRLTLEITDVRVERLNDCSEADAEAEGVSGSGDTNVWPPCAKAAYQELWDQINGADMSRAWAANPWVWAVTFEVAQ